MHKDAGRHALACHVKSYECDYEHTKYVSQYEILGVSNLITHK